MLIDPPIQSGVCSFIVDLCLLCVGGNAEDVFTHLALAGIAATLMSMSAAQSAHRWDACTC
jgi:hypothetical protein